MSVLEICNDIFLLTQSSLALKLAPALQMLFLPLKPQSDILQRKFSFIASLDISKAFDRVHRFKLYNYLLSAGIPVVIVDVLCNLFIYLL